MRACDRCGGQVAVVISTKLVGMATANTPNNPDMLYFDPNRTESLWCGECYETAMRLLYNHKDKYGAPDPISLTPVVLP